jgi:phage terminase small subunit
LLSILWALPVLHAENKVMVMPPLDNPRWERFAQELAKGQSQTGAYLAAGYKGAKSPTTAASRLLTNVKILERVRELQERGADRAEVTVESLIREAEEIRKEALAARQFSAAIAAVREKGVLSGKRVERSERGVPGEYADLENMTADELREQFAALVSAVAAAEGVGDTGAALSKNRTSRSNIVGPSTAGNVWTS